MKSALKSFSNLPEAQRPDQHLTPKRLASGLGVAVSVVLTLACCGGASGALRVVAATTDLAALAREIGGGMVEVESLSRPNQDPHGFEILPRHVVAVRRADVYLKVGAGLDYWSDELLGSAGNSGVVVAECSEGVRLLAEEGGQADGHGHHAHEAGNPHYWLGASNIPAMALSIAGALSRSDPANAVEYARNLHRFAARWDSARAAWQERMAVCHDLHIVTYHRAWDYFVREYGLHIIGTVEPHPGAEPSPASLVRLERAIIAENARVLLLEPFESERWARLLATDTGIAIVKTPPSVGAVPEAGDIFSLFDFLTRAVSAHCTSPHAN